MWLLMFLQHFIPTLPGACVGIRLFGTFAQKA